MSMNCSLWLVTYIMPISEYIWAIMVLYLTNLSYVAQL